MFGRRRFSAVILQLFPVGPLEEEDCPRTLLLNKCCFINACNGFPSQKATNKEQPEVRSPEAALEYNADLYPYDRDTVLGFFFVFFYHISCAKNI